MAALGGSGGKGPTLRLLGPGDIAQALALDVMCHKDHWTLDNVLDELARPVGMCLGAFSGQLLAAMVIGWLLQPEFHVLNLAVHPDFRRQGLGRGLMTAALDLARRCGAPICHLETRVGNAPAERLYESLGFKVSGLRPAYYHDGSDAAIMTLGGDEPAGGR
jgi:ribosomal-protein-alanine N-acetyltransferase